MDLTQVITATLSTRMHELVKEITDDVMDAIAQEQSVPADSRLSTPLAMLLRGDAISAELMLKQRGITLNKLTDILIVRPTDNDYTSALANLSAVLDDEHRLHLSDILDGHLVILTSLERGNLDLWEEIDFYLQNCTSISSIFFHTQCKDIPELKKIFHDYCKNYAALERIFQGRKILDIHDLGLAKEILALARAEKDKEHILSIINALKDDNDDLMETLAIYLIDCDAQLSKTASTLYLHRNTVSYRLNKIKQISGSDFTKMPAAYDYYSAAALWRLIS